MKLTSSLINLCEGEEHKEELKKILLENQILVKFLRKAISKKIDNVRSERENKKTYSQTAWPYQQADANGEIRGLKFLLDILPEV